MPQGEPHLQLSAVTKMYKRHVVTVTNPALTITHAAPLTAGKKRGQNWTSGSSLIPETFNTSYCPCPSPCSSEDDVGSGEAEVLQHVQVFASHRPDVNLFLGNNDDPLLKKAKFHPSIILEAFTIKRKSLAAPPPALPLLPRFPKSHRQD